MERLTAGLSANSTTVVDAGNTASAMGSGDLPVFATPAMVALMENAAMKAVAEHLADGQTTVGAAMHVTHSKPSGLGAEITAAAVLAEADGRKLVFRVEARDADGIIGEGEHVRYVVDRARFLSKVR
ncbi:MAG: thioesterase family protein [Alistipes senegalensis]|nr:thioesterase family protein [Bacteroides cellulosilyticus]MCM1352759.1 thioesterase family protein [Alistipes senegalensis]